MSLVVQKFGGTSVADAQKILAAASKAVAWHKAGNQVVVVVSAMGHQTDVLVDLAKQINQRPRIQVNGARSASLESLKLPESPQKHLLIASTTVSTWVGLKKSQRRQSHPRSTRLQQFF